MGVIRKIIEINVTIFTGITSVTYGVTNFTTIFTTAPISVALLSRKAFVISLTPNIRTYSCTFPL